MTERLPRFAVDGFELRWGEIPGLEDPKDRRLALLLVIRGQGWRVVAMPFFVRLGPFTLPVLSVSKDQRELVAVVPDDLVPDLEDGLPVVVEQWGRVAEAKEAFTRDKLPTRPRRRPAGRGRKKS